MWTNSARPGGNVEERNPSRWVLRWPALTREGCRPRRSGWSRYAWNLRGNRLNDDYNGERGIRTLDGQKPPIPVSETGADRVPNRPWNMAIRFGGERNTERRAIS